MEDDKGIYYYPFPRNPRVRMYVRPVGDEVCFRMDNLDDPGMWDAHGWMPWKAIQEAIALGRGAPGFDPRRAYDLRVARALIREKSGEREKRPAG